MSDIATPGIDVGDCFPLSEARRYFPRPGGRRIAIGTLYRWTSHGVRGARLRTIRLGQQLCTCDVWIREFIEDMNASRPNAARDMRPTDQELARRRRVDAALDAAGL